MVYHTEKHIERARQHIDSGNDARLPYACLELRYALERIAYQKLRLRLGDTGAKQIDAWQPARVIESLMELVDDGVAKDFTFSISKEPADGRPSSNHEYVVIGSHKAVDPKLIGKFWHKLGSYLHVPMPSKKTELSPEPGDRVDVAALNAIIDYVRCVSESKFDAHFSVKFEFACDKCGELIVRNHRLLKNGDVVECQSPNCDASYLIRREGDDLRYKRRTFTIAFPQCGHSKEYDAKELLQFERGKSYELKCSEHNCSSTQTVVWALMAEEATSTPTDSL